MTDDLAKRCEQIDGPNRELDESIHDLMPVPKVVVPLSYTRSIDDALMIVPEGWTWGHLQRKDRQPEFAALLRPTTPGSDFWTGYVLGVAKSPALAMCAAALRARSCSVGNQPSD